MHDVPVRSEAWEGLTFRASLTDPQPSNSLQRERNCFQSHTLGSRARTGQQWRLHRIAVIVGKHHPHGCITVRG